MTFCGIDGCDNLIEARGWCQLHYNRWRTKGDPRWEPPTFWERFWDRVEVGDCWEWTGAKHSPERPYGRVTVDGRLRYAHRVAYEYLVGPVPEGLVLDHLCRNPPCVNPDHLEPVTDRVNLERGPRILNKPTHCKWGHPFDEANTYHYTFRGKPWRLCRACATRREAERRARLAV